VTFLRSTDTQVSAVWVAAVSLLAIVVGPACAQPPDTVFLEELTWTELRAAVQAGKTTIIVPIAIEVKILFPAKNMPAIAMSTVAPEMSTAWPDVPAAVNSARCGSAPRRRSSRSRWR